MGNAVKAVNHQSTRITQNILFDALRFTDQAQILEVPIHLLSVSFGIWNRFDHEINAREFSHGIAVIDGILCCWVR